MRGRLLVAAVITLATTLVPVASSTAAHGNPWPHVVVNGFSTASGNGYWLLYADGSVRTAGDARFFGDASGLPLRGPVVGGAITPDGHGYWLVASDGGIFTYGSARFFGSMGGARLNQPVFSMAPTTTGRGYWLVARDGGMFSFGDARFYGSMGGTRLRQPIAGMNATTTGWGYRLVARDGGVFSFGDARFFGSLPQRGIAVADVVGLAPSPANGGYWMARSGGSVYAFGNAKNYGGIRTSASDRLAAIFPTAHSDGYRVVTQRGAVAAFGTRPAARPAATPPPVPAPTTTTTVPATSGMGATLTGPPSGSQVCPGHTDAGRLVSPFKTAAAAQSAFPQNGTPITVPAGDNRAMFGSTAAANRTYWFAAGTHTLGTGQFSQIVPQNGDVFVGAPGAIIDGQNVNQFAFTQHATHVTIKYLEVKRFVAPQDQGVVNHDAGSDWTMAFDYFHDNRGAALMGGARENVTFSCLTRNGQYAVNSCCGDNGSQVNQVFDHNEVSFNDLDNIEASHPGCGCTGGFKFWDVRGAKVTNSYVHDNYSVGIWADTNNTGFDIENNYIADNYAEGLMYEISYNAYIHNNVFVGNAKGEGPTAGVSGFPTAALYISESGSDSRVQPTTCGTLNCGATTDISRNTFTDNWGGVTLWENSNRYCASPANTSSGDCTLVNPTVANVTTCGTAQIATSPYIGDCRWKTQNVEVHNNVFSLNPANVTSCDHTNGHMCGYNGVFSQYGGPAQSPGDPYLGTFVENDITFHQHNQFSNNAYRGYWCFDPLEQGNSDTFSTWRASPYNQDTGSTYSNPNPSC